MDLSRLVRESQPFLAWLTEWYNSRPRLSADEVFAHSARTAILSVDVINGFCSQGPLASDRVAGIVQPIVALFQAAYRRGVRHLILIQDHHPADAVEFGSYPPHCVAGTREAETVPEFTRLPFFDQFLVLSKNSISSSIDTGLEGWLEAHPEVDTLVVVGDCTDLCTYQLALHLRLRANALHRPGVRVIVPIDGVQTYDLPLEAAQSIGAVPHPGDLLHLVFLYSMMLNGVEVVAGIAG